MALRFTTGGAVGAPTTLQIRVGPGAPGRIRVGVSAPSRALSEAEVLSNAAHFRNPGPRSAPVERVVLSGVPDDWLAQRLLAVIQGLREHGLSTVVLHLTGEQLAGIAGLDGCDLVVTSEVPSSLPPPGERVDGSAVALTLPLTNRVLERLGEVLDAAERFGPARVTWVWPFPDGTAARPVAASKAANTLAQHLGRWTDAPFPWGIKGLPRCTLSPLASVVSLTDRIWRTRNRYYVDSEHQGKEALMFEPDLVRLVKSDRCRFCAVDNRCDGVADRWLAEGLVTTLTPLEFP
ncbi:MAG: hypothetical protein AAGA48_05705 [Myxococcota bacterium]